MGIFLVSADAVWAFLTWRESSLVQPKTETLRQRCYISAAYRVDPSCNEKDQ